MAGLGGPAARRVPVAEHGHSDRVVGTLVHRMMQRFGLDLAGGTTMMRQAALSILRSDEALAASVERTSTEVADATVEFYRLICGTNRCPRAVLGRPANA